jgi:hypothetical protein
MKQRMQQEDSKLSGSFEAQGSSKLLNGTLQGNRVSRNVGGEKRAINLTGMVEGDKMSGTTEQGSSWSATRPGGNGFGTQTWSRCIGWRRRRWRNAGERTGGVYGFLAPTSEQPRRPGEWQTYDITRVGRVVTVVQNSQTIIDRQEIPGITGGALDSHEGLPGPIYLQGREAGHVAFRNITIAPAR